MFETHNFELTDKYVRQFLQSGFKHPLFNFTSTEHILHKFHVFHIKERDHSKQCNSNVAFVHQH